MAVLNIEQIKEIAREIAKEEIAKAKAELAIGSDKTTSKGGKK